MLRTVTELKGPVSKKGMSSTKDDSYDVQKTKYAYCNERHLLENCDSSQFLTSQRRLQFVKRTCLCFAFLKGKVSVELLGGRTQLFPPLLSKLNFSPFCICKCSAVNEWTNVLLKQYYEIILATQPYHQYRLTEDAHSCKLSKKCVTNNKHI
ncbi:hypothetical protein EWB00_005351 [Schistosoma japonicum]|uniref:Uncharacterized protein n=1 Tax=Schistosoma japonicum TaxID=6182 RepID=A0A4Z2D1J5_SCHJA|nr:hypothetical protein KSF78_0007171 [Schistosoma japonicum]TNN10375.1 hypothetical protein EWB00_005351 [Schistosoma japonicum]